VTWLRRAVVLAMLATLAAATWQAIRGAIYMWTREYGAAAWATWLLALLVFIGLALSAVETRLTRRNVIRGGRPSGTPGADGD
jgi:hypothetical protein